MKYPLMVILVLCGIVTPPRIAAQAGGETLAKAIAKTVDYLEKKKGHVMPMMISTLDHLNKNYGLNIDIKQQKTQIFIRPPKKRRALLRFMDEQFIVPEYEIRDMVGLDAVTAEALYCDIYALPRDFSAKINMMTRASGYSLTHATLALVILRQRGCKNTGIDLAAELDRHAKLLTALILKQGPESDVGTEAIVFLYLAGHGKAVRKEWIDRIIRSQKPHGACGNNDHTTVLALWAMLEAQRHHLRENPLTGKR